MFSNNKQFAHETYGSTKPNDHHLIPQPGHWSTKGRITTPLFPQFSQTHGSTKPHDHHPIPQPGHWSTRGRITTPWFSNTNIGPYAPQHHWRSTNPLDSIQSLSTGQWTTKGEDPHFRQSGGQYFPSHASNVYPISIIPYDNHDSDLHDMLST